MDEKERTLKDIEKLEKRLVFFKKHGLYERYLSVYECAHNYFLDAKHFFSEGKYFTAFGAANYAYGFLDAVITIEGKMDEKTDDR